MLLATTKRSLVVAVLVSAVVIVGVVGIAYYTEVSGDRLHEQAQLIANQETEQTLLFELEASADQTESLRSRVDQLFLDRSDVIDFLSAIESFNSNQVSVVVDTIEEQTNTAVPTLRIPLSIDGEQAATQLVLKSLETLPYASYLDAITIAVTTDGAGVTQYVTDVTLVIGIQETL